MFKLIGFAVVAFVVYISWDTLNGLWKGDLSGEEAATAIRQDVGKAISEQPRGGEDTSRNQGASTTQNRTSGDTPSAPRSAEQLADELLKKR